MLSFVKNQIDGPMLEAIIHPVLGNSTLANLGIEKAEEQLKLISEINKMKNEV